MTFTADRSTALLCAVVTPIHTHTIRDRLYLVTYLPYLNLTCPDIYVLPTIILVFAVGRSDVVIIAGQCLTSTD